MKIKEGLNQSGHMSRMATKVLQFHKTSEHQINKFIDLGHKAD